MAKSVVNGRDVAFAVEKTAGSGVYTRVGCVGDVSLSINTDSDEVTCSDSQNWKEFAPGQMHFDGSGNLTVRQLTNAPAGADPVANPAQTDATDGVSVENFIDYQIAGRKIKMRVTLGTGSGAARYEGLVFITKSDLKAQIKGAATYAVSFQGTGELAKTLTP